MNIFAEESYANNDSGIEVSLVYCAFDKSFKLFGFIRRTMQVKLITIPFWSLLSLKKYTVSIIENRLYFPCYIKQSLWNKPFGLKAAFSERQTWILNISMLFWAQIYVGKVLNQNLQ